MKLHEIYPHFNKDIEIDKICHDSRNVEKNTLFVCIVGAAQDGHAYALAAQESGASAIIAERELEGITVPLLVVEDTKEALAICAGNFYSNPASKMKLIGITGTNGKTTTTYMVKSVLESVGKKVGLIGTNQNMVGDEILNTERTTPDSLELHELLAKMYDAGCEYIVMEVSSHALDRNRVFGCDFEVGAFTNLTGDHLDYHKNMQNYLVAKMKLFDISDKKIVNTDDTSGQIIAKKYKVFKYGLKKGDIHTSHVKYKSDHVAFTCHYGKEKVPIYLGIPGIFSVYNALTAIGICLNLDIPLKQIAEGLKTVKGVKGRVEVVETDRDCTVLIDYAHTPDGLKNVLQSVRGFCKGRLIVLFGCGGGRDKTKRPLMGNIATDLADYSIITSDNPRSEEPRAIIKDILGGVEGDKYIVIENRAEAIKYALDYAKKDDIIILAGKGHETYQVLKDKTIHFDEREIIRESSGG